jgi:DNA-binding MarR family transcriptional regulator
VDDLVRTKIIQQQWLNTEQWDGYSDTYLTRHMLYGSTVEAPTSQLTPKQPILHPLLTRVFTLYGPLANVLHDLQDDPLHPAFHHKMDRDVKPHVEKIAEELDRVYPTLHPTVKTLYDAYLVRRYFHLQDWIKHVEKKRAELLSRLSPEYIEQALTGRQVAERHMESLRRIAPLFSSSAGDADEGMLQLTPGSMFSVEEIQVLKQRARYTRNMRRLGANWDFADQHTV